VAIWTWPALPGKSEELWTILGLPGSPAETRGDDAKPRFGAAAPRALGQPKILFPRLELAQVAGA